MEYLEIIEPYALVIYYLLVSAVILLIILDNKKPEKSFAYIFLILLFPVGGIIIYLLFGAQYHRKKLFTKKRYFDKVFLNQVNKEARDNARVDLKGYSKLPTLFYNIQQVNFTLNNEVQILNNGEEKFPVLLQELKKAEKSIHLDYYIIKDDKIGTEILDILCEKSSKGLTIRIIYDDVGSSISRSSIAKLKDHGIEIYPYMPVLFSRLAHKANYRNHRKILIIDNKTGFVGGINIKDKYINPNDMGLYWRDTHVKITGEAVIDLQYLFISDWYFVSGQKIDFEEVIFRDPPQLEKKIPISILGSDNGQKNQTIEEAFFGMITNARKEILITTPYFVPDESILKALKISAKSGVKVKIVVPERTDIQTAYYASQTYFKGLLLSGVEIYYYTKGMMHSKTMIVDESMSTVGSTNMDQRSFSMNAEVNAFILDPDLAKSFKRYFENDLKDCIKLSIEDLDRRSLGVKIISSIARLLAPVL